MAKPLVPFDKREGWIWLDGEFVQWADARIHVLTHGLHYASCVYEGERAYGGRVFKLREHTQRLLRSATTLDMRMPFSLLDIERASEELLERNGVEDGYLRPVVWRGSEQISTSARASSIHMAIACWSWPSYYDEAARAQGIRLKTAVWRRPPPSCSPYEAKASSHYMIATLCKHDAEAKGFDDALMLDWRGHIAEATSANIFLAAGGVLFTPPPDCFLDGITRRTVIELARARGLSVIERPITPDELPKFDECFLTGTAAEVCPVRQIDDVLFKPADIGLELMRVYARLVRS
ncbi:branched-chain amino acid aminotransferase [Azotobacter chroococcum]|uniref:branched-chain amino acid aminotransferase n=1 Tax=Azotobacter chroococcum TaxID=353 RepID=UPI00103F0A83|nr:branched-chain amino acid aminotransferase [Azotobacter chroococcum]TBW34000.1 branched-chain amino acid aminotransferase [Azotobacter chroococcum]